MALEMVGAQAVAGSIEIPVLVRNTSITVTIDDLAEGLLVVSFTHGDNLYQGVLFQLNRERGIPSGISFAKEPALGNLSSEKAGGDILLAQQPLNKRHLYNPGSSHLASLSTRTQPSLRRIIKPPERFKNAKMSLRARPVLCAKCRTLCEDKSENSVSKTIEPPKDDNQTEKNKGKGRPCKQLASFPSANLNGKENGTGGKHQTLTSSIPIVSDTDPQDLSYESVGSTGVVANYWKRPLVQPLLPSSEETYSRLRKHKGNWDYRNKRKRGNTMASYSHQGTAKGITGVGSVASSNSSAPVKSVEEKVSTEALPDEALKNTFMCTATLCDSNVPITRRRKELCLKMCITKITDLRNGDCAKDDESKCASEEKTSTVSGQDFQLHSENALGSEVIDTSNKRKVHGIRSKRRISKSSKKDEQEWGDRIRTKSNVPARYRDESSPAKNIFSFNKRRSPVDGEDIPVLTICRNEIVNSFAVSNTSEVSDKSDDMAISKVCENSQTFPQPSSSSCISVEESNEKSKDGPIPIKPIPTLSSFSSEERGQNIRTISTTKPSEMIKTPSIKITFGSSGNGMVVQIPPKPAQTPEEMELKATKKALKKAKKEAKRKRSTSPDLSPALSDMSLEHSVKSEEAHTAYPTMPFALSQQDEAICNNSSITSGTTSHPFSVLEHQPSESPGRIIKKKKQKKRRRSSKHLKENYSCAAGGSTSLDLSLIGAISDPFPIQDCGNHEVGNANSATLSIKSVGFESISNPSTPEPMLSAPSSLPPRRQSVPPSSTANPDNPKRVCINLKRVDRNAYVPLPNLHSISSQDEEVEDEDLSLSEKNNCVIETDDCDPSEFPVNGSSNGTDMDDGALSSESVDYYKDEGTDCVYRVGDVVWGKLPACPWWPGKISEILLYGSDDARAIISWYKSNTQSCVLFKMLLPFTEYFDKKYTKSRRRGSYQSAVSAAMADVQKLNPEDLNQRTDDLQLK